MSKLVKAFTLAVTDERALEIRDEVLSGGDGRRREVIKRLVPKERRRVRGPHSSDRLEGHLHRWRRGIFSAAGLKNPNLSIPSDDFLADMSSGKRIWRSKFL